MDLYIICDSLIAEKGAFSRHTAVCCENALFSCMSAWLIASRSFVGMAHCISNAMRRRESICVLHVNVVKCICYANYTFREMTRYTAYSKK